MFSNRKNEHFVSAQYNSDFIFVLHNSKNRSLCPLETTNVDEMIYIVIISFIFSSNPAHLETQKEGIIVQKCFCPENLNGCLCQKEIKGGFTNIASRGFVHDTKNFNAENDRGSKDGDRAKKDTSVLSPAQQFMDSLPPDSIVQIIIDNLPDGLREKFKSIVNNRLHQRD